MQKYHQNTNYLIIHLNNDILLIVAHCSITLNPKLILFISFHWRQTNLEFNYHRTHTSPTTVKELPVGRTRSIRLTPSI
jgi:hypothetical protein